MRNVDDKDEGERPTATSDNYGLGSRNERGGNGSIGTPQMTKIHHLIAKELGNQVGIEKPSRKQIVCERLVDNQYIGFRN